MFSDPAFSPDVPVSEKGTSRKQLSVTDAQAVVGTSTAEIIIRAAGVTVAELPNIRGVRWVEEDSIVPCHAILVMPEADIENLYNRLWYSDQLLTPVINATGKILARADAVITAYTGQALCDAIVDVLPIIQRVNSLPPRPSVHRDAWLALALSYTREQTIEARWAPENSALVTYPLLTGLPHISDALDEMVRQGLLGRVFFERAHECSHCHSRRVLVREECQKCHSSHLREEQLIHHYACSHQAPKSEFLQDGRLNCPKCHDRLKHYSVDYDASGTIIICEACGYSSGEAEIGFVCMDCGGHTSAIDARTNDIFHYTLTQQGISAVVAGVMPGSLLLDNTPEAARVISFYEFKRTVIRELRRAKRYSRTTTSVMAIDIRVSADRVEQLGLASMGALYQQITDVAAENLDVVVQKLRVMATNIFAVETIFRRMDNIENFEQSLEWPLVA